MLLFSSNSIVNLMSSEIQLRCSKNLFNSYFMRGHITLVSSTYLLHLLGFMGYESNALLSKFSIKMLATIEDPLQYTEICWGNIATRFNIHKYKLVKTHINVGVKLSSEQCPKTEEEVEYMSHVLIQVFLKFLCMPLSILDRTLPMHWEVWENTCQK